MRSLGENTVFEHANAIACTVSARMGVLDGEMHSWYVRSTSGRDGPSE